MRQDASTRNRGGRKYTGVFFVAGIGILLLLLIGGKNLPDQRPASWVSLSSQEISRPSGKGFQIFFPGKDVYALALGENEWIVGGANGLFSVNPRTGAGREWTGLRYVYALLRVEDQILVGFDGGILEFAGDKPVRNALHEALVDKRVRSLFRDSSGRIWAGTFGGALRDDGLRADQSTGLAADMVNQMMESQDGSMWFGSYIAPRGGISILQGEKIRRFENLAHPNVTAMLELEEGLVLTGGGLYTKGGGDLFRKETDGWKMVQRIEQKDGLAGAKIRSLFRDSLGRLWIGSEYDGLGIYDMEFTGQTMRLHPVLYLKQKDGLADDEIKVIQENDTHYFVGTLGGLTVIEKSVLLERISSAGKK